MIDPDDCFLGHALAEVQAALPGWIVGLVIGPETLCTLTPPYMAAPIEWEASRKAIEGRSRNAAQAVTRALESVIAVRSSFCAPAC